MVGQVSTNEDDVLFGLGNDDVMFGMSGNDVLIAGAGNDTVQGVKVAFREINPERLSQSLTN